MIVPQDDDKYGKGIVYYLKNRKVVGVLTWNMFNKMKPAREVIREGKEFADYSELAKLIKIETKDH
jgi:programmed cell death 8 (apoptosis-inducing factor)